MQVSFLSERLLVLAGVAVLAALGGAHLLVWQAGEAARWSAAHGWLVFGIWAAMMLATMTPAAAAMLRACAGIVPAAFLAGHFALWTGISAVAALAHWGLHAVDPLIAGMAFANPVAGGILLMGAGAYLLSPLKAACLAKNRGLAGFRHWERRDGAAGAFATGLRHATHCVGRCWALMALMFVGGVMSPLWIVVLTLIAMAERILPYGESIAHGIAVAAIGWGLWMLAGMLV